MGYKPRTPNGPDSCNRRPSKPIGPRTGWPANPRGELPSLLSQRVQEPDLPGHVAAPDLAPRVRAMPVTWDVRSKGVAPPDRHAGVGAP